MYLRVIIIIIFKYKQLFLKYSSEQMGNFLLSESKILFLLRHQIQPTRFVTVASTRYTVYFLKKETWDKKNKATTSFQLPFIFIQTTAYLTVKKTSGTYYILRIINEKCQFGTVCSVAAAVHAQVRFKQVERVGQS